MKLREKEREMGRNIKEPETICNLVNPSFRSVAFVAQKRCVVSRRRWLPPRSCRPLHPNLPQPLLSYLRPPDAAPPLLHLLDPSLCVEGRCEQFPGFLCQRVCSFVALHSFVSWVPSDFDCVSWVRKNKNKNKGTPSQYTVVIGRLYFA